MWSIGEFLGIIIIYPAFLYFIVVLFDGIGFIKDNFNRKT